MTTFYVYVLIIHSVTSHEHCVQDSVVVVVFFTYEYKPSVPPVEQKRYHLETDTLP